MKDKKTFGNFIKEKRINKNYSQKDLAEILFVTESAISKWERGVTYPDITLITAICKALDISEKELIESSDDNEYRKIKKNSDKFNKIKKTLFWTLTIMYLTAIMICFIVNLAVNHTLSWFFIVLASILVAYSFCPTFTVFYEKYKFLIFIGSTFISLFILFLTCSIYSANYWFMIPTIGVLLGYFIIFYPILFNKQKNYLNEEKYNNLSRLFLLTYFFGMFLIIILLLVFIHLYNPFNLWLGLVITICRFIIPILFGTIYLFKPQKQIYKFLLIILNSILVIRFTVGIISSSNLNRTVIDKTYQIEENYNDIKIDLDNYNIHFYLSENNESKIVYKENKKVHLDIEINNNALVISEIDNRRFYESFFGFNKLVVEIYLSKDIINLTEIEYSTGNVIINSGLTFNDLDIKGSTGNVNLDTDVLNNMKVETTTGNIKISNSKITNDLEITASTGNIDLTNVLSKTLNIKISTGRTKLNNVIIEKDFNMNGSTGNLILDGFDAENIYIELSTGDVRGTILTSKFFIAQSDTGHVNVPKTREGGVCEIIVDTGDIEITYK